MEKEVQCSECNKLYQPTKEIRYPCTPCDTCRKLVCNNCSGCSASEIKCLPLRTRLLKFICSKCRNYDLIDCLQNTIKDKDQIISDKNEIIKMLQDKVKQLEELEKAHPKSLSFAGAVRMNVGDNERRINCPNIIVKPKKKQNATKTKLDLNSNINPAELKVAVKQLKETKEGSVIIACQTKNDIDTLEQAIKEKLNNTYEIQLTKMRKPRIKIVSFTQNMSEEEINKSIVEQNDIQGSVKTTYIKKMKNGSSTVYCECSSSAFKQIVRLKKLSIGWERFPVFEDLDVPRCFKCQGFYHRKDNCSNKVACPFCSEEHEESSCPKEHRCCINCIRSNERYKTKYKVDHFAYEVQCPSLEYHKQVLQQKTDYL